MSWTETDFKAIAKFPFSNSKKGYLRLITGDHLHILKETEGWYFAKNESTSLEGICPKDFVNLLSDGSFSLIDIECSEILNDKLIKETIFCDCDPSTEQASMTADYASLLPHYQQALNYYGKERNEEETQSFVKALNYLRKFIGINPEVHRNTNEAIITTTDLSTTDFIESKAESTGNNLETTCNVTLKLNVTLNQEARIIPRLYAIDSDFTKAKILCAPADFYHEKSEHSIEHKVVIPNLDLKCAYILEVRVLNHKKFGEKSEKSNNIWGNEYIAVGADYILEHGRKEATGKPPIELDEFGAATFDMNMYMPADSSSPHNVPSLCLLESHKNKVTPSPELSTISVDFELKKVNTEAFSPDGETSVHVLRELSHITPSYHANSLIVHLVELKHKTAIKRTRVVLHVLDYINKKFVKGCFERMKEFNNGDYFASVVEKGSKDFIVDEMTTINLNKFDPTKCCLVFEVQRTSRSKGTVHESSYGFHFLTEPGNFDPKIVASNDLEKTYTLYLEKPPKFTEVELSKYALQQYEFLKSLPKDPQQRAAKLNEKTTKTQIRYYVKINSTKYTNLPNIASLVRWDDLKKEDPKSAENQIKEYLTSSSTEVPRYFFTPVLRVLSLAMKMPEYSKSAVKKAQEILSKLDRDTQRHPEIMLFYNEFIDMVRTEKELAGIHVSILEFLNQSIPDEVMIKSIQATDPNVEKIAKTARTLPYFLPIISASVECSKGFNKESDSSSLTKTLSDLAKKIVLIFGNNNLLKSHAFLSTVYQIVCDIIIDTFEPKEAIKLITPLITCCCSSSVGPKAHQVRMKTPNIKGFTMPEMHRDLFKAFIDSLEDYKDMQIHTFFGLVPLFFSVLKYSDDFTSDIVDIYHFTERLMYSEDTEEDKITSDNIKHYIKRYSENFKQILDKNLVDGKFKCQYRQIKTMHEYNPYFLILLVYYGGSEAFKRAMEQRKNKTAFFWKFLTLIHTVLDQKDIIEKPEFFFICLPAALNVLSVFYSFPELINSIAPLIIWISSVFKLFRKKIQELNMTDYNYYQRIYPVGLKDFGGMLSSLYYKLPEGERFITSIVTPFFDSFLSTDDEEIKKEITDSFKILIREEYKLTGKLEETENAVMEALNSLSGDQALKGKLLGLITLFDDASKDFDGEEFNQFFKRTKKITQDMHVINTIDTDEKHEIQKTKALISILQSTLDNKDIKLFLNFSSIFYKVNIELKNKVEAAELLYYTASKLEWGNNAVIPEGNGLSSRTVWERKKECLLKAIPLYMEMFFYKKGLMCVEELKKLYISTYDYDELSKLCCVEKKLYDFITAGELPPLNTFYGIKFYDVSDEVCKNKTFVFCCHNNMNANKVITNYKGWFPDATVSSKPPEDPKEAGAYIHVFNLVPDVSDDNFNMNEDQNDYKLRHTSKVDKFYSKVPITHKRQDRSLGETAETFIFVENFKTPIPMESYTRYIEAESYKEPYEMQPIECAIEQVREKSVEILVKAGSLYRDMVNNHEFDKGQLSPLTMLLNGIANAGVNGGIGVYLNTFFGDNDFVKEKLNVELAPKLREAIIDQIRILRWGITLDNILTDDGTAAVLIKSVIDGTKKLFKMLTNWFAKDELEKREKQIKEAKAEEEDNDEEEEEFDYLGFYEQPSFIELPSLDVLDGDKKASDYF